MRPQKIALRLQNLAQRSSICRVREGSLVNAASQHIIFNLRHLMICDKEVDQRQGKTIHVYTKTEGLSLSAPTGRRPIS